MGCRCSKSLNDQNFNVEEVANEENKLKSDQDRLDNKDDEDNHYDTRKEDNNNNEALHTKVNNKSKIKKQVDYVKEVLDIINRVRTDPMSFVPDIKKAISNIKESNGKLIYASKLKVSLCKGEEAFNNAAEVLSLMSPVEPLVFKEELCIDCPEDEGELKDTKAFMKRIIEKKKTTQLDAYFKDAVRDPYISTLLIIIDDSKNNAGRKRDVVLSKDYKYIAITSAKVGKSFCAYFTFSK